MKRLRLDLHIHTRASHDCRSDYADVVEAARIRGLDRIAVTDHNVIDGAFRVRDLAGDLVIVGEEVRTAEGADLTGLYLHERIAPGAPALETAQAIRDQGGLVYVPHPFAGRKGLGEDALEELAPWIDVVEIFNARVHDEEVNRRAARWAAAHALPGGAGSDAHTVREIGRGVIEVATFEDSRKLVGALRTGRVIGTTSSRWVHLASTWAKLAGKFA